MANTYEKIATVTVGSTAQAEIEFTSIPATYTDLILYASVRCDLSAAGRESIFGRINGSTSSYDYRRYYGYASGNKAADDGQNYGWIEIGGIAPASSADSNAFNTLQMYFPSYTSSNHKVGYWNGNVFAVGVTDTVNVSGGYVWKNTSAITSFKLYLSTNGVKFTQHSTATLFGIKNS